MTLVPAYGRDYKSQKAVLADWNSDKDFIINDLFDVYDGKPCNKTDLKRAGKTFVQIRYNKLAKVLGVKV